jgi:hypothetical protein
LKFDCVDAAKNQALRRFVPDNQSRLISYDIYIKRANDFRDLARTGNQTFDFL